MKTGLTKEEKKVAKPFIQAAAHFCIAVGIQIPGYINQRASITQLSREIAEDVLALIPTTEDEPS